MWPTLLWEVAYQNPIGQKHQRWLRYGSRVVFVLVIEVDVNVLAGGNKEYRLCATLWQRQSPINVPAVQGQPANQILFGGGNNAPAVQIFPPTEFGDFDQHGVAVAPAVRAAGVNVIHLDPAHLWNEGVVPSALLPAVTIDIDLFEIYNAIHLAQPAP